MRIVCPACQAAYEVPEKLLSGAPRKVRCARCGDAWTPEPAAVAAPVAEEPAPPEPEREPEPEPMAQQPAPVPEPEATDVVPRAAERLVAEPAGPADRLPVVLAAAAWGMSIVLLAAGIWAMVAWRAEIMAAWAPSRRLFSLLGLA